MRADAVSSVRADLVADDALTVDRLAPGRVAQPGRRGRPGEASRQQGGREISRPKPYDPSSMKVAR